MMIMNVALWRMDSSALFDTRKPHLKLGIRPKDKKIYMARHQEMKKRRLAISSPATLERISSNRIFLHASRFLTFDTIFKGHANNPFASLTEEMVKEMMEGSRLLDILESSSCRLCFVLQVLNPQITECPKKWTKNMPVASKTIVFRHLLQNCPKMKKIEVTLRSYEDVVALPRSRPVDILQMMANQWPNLTCLKMTEVRRGHEENSDLVFEMISRHLPALSELEIVLSVETLTMDGVKHLSQMNKLKYLGVVLENCSSDQNILLIVLAVGELPLIERFSIINSKPSERHDNRFVDVFGRMYPRKRLTLKSMCIATDLEKTWPECLTLEELSIDESSLDKTNLGSCNNYRNLLTGRCFPTKVTFKGVGSDGIYPLVETFGPAGLTDLTVEARHNKEPLDVCRVIAACPKLQNIQINSNDLTENSVYKITPEHFQGFESFGLSLEEDNSTSRLLVSKLYRNYLIGSRRFLTRLTLNKVEELDDVLWALHQERHTCMDQVEEIVFDTQTFIFSGDNQIQKKALTLVLLLALRSLNLRKVELDDICEEVLPPKWYQKAFKELGIPLRAHGPSKQSSDSSDDDQNYYCCEEDSDMKKMPPFPKSSFS